MWIRVVGYSMHVLQINVCPRQRMALCIVLGAGNQAWGCDCVILSIFAFAFISVYNEHCTVDYRNPSKKKEFMSKSHPHLISRDPILDRIMILSLKWVQKYLFYDKIVYINANLFISYHLIHCVFLVHSWPLFLKQVRGCDRCTWNLDFLSQTVWCQLISDHGNCLKC